MRPQFISQHLCTCDEALRGVGSSWKNPEPWKGQPHYEEWREAQLDCWHRFINANRHLRRAGRPTMRCVQGLSPRPPSVSPGTAQALGQWPPGEGLKPRRPDRVQGGVGRILQDRSRDGSTHTGIDAGPSETGDGCCGSANFTGRETAS